jgi:ATP-dependent DNA helicase DinG
MQLDSVANFFKESTIAKGTNKIGKYREAQERYAIECAKFLSLPTNKNVTLTALLEAGTGVGKSLGYLFPLLISAASTGNRVGVATFSRHLQRQLIDDVELVINAIAPVVGRKLTYGVRYGSDAYVHLGALLYQREELTKKISNKEKQSLDCFIEWATISVNPEHPKHDERIYTGRTADYIEQNKLDKLPGGISESDIAIRYYDSEDERYCHLRDVERSKKSDILIVTHHMLMLHTKTGYEILDDERKIDTLVIDEADKLSDAAESVFEGSFSINRHYSQFEKLAQDELHLQESFSCFEALNDYLITMAGLVKEKPYSLTGDLKYAPTISMLSNRLVSSINKSLNFVGASKENEAQVRSIACLAHELSGFTNLLDKENTNNAQMIVPYAKWSQIHEFPSLQLKSINTGFLTAKLFSKHKDTQENMINKIMYTSATLTSKGYGKECDFSAIETMLGLSAGKASRYSGATIAVKKAYNAHDYGNISMFLAPSNLGHPLKKFGQSRFDFNPDFIDYVSKAAQYAIQSPPIGSCKKRTLLLCTSYREVRVLAEQLKHENLNVIEHKEGTPLSHLLSRFRESEDGVLITPAAWEGFNEEIANLIITRVPFLPVDVITQDKIAFIKDKGFNKNVASAIVHQRLRFDCNRKLAQGIGRLIRKENDKGRLFLTDPRIKKNTPELWVNLLGETKFSSNTFDLADTLKTRYQHEAWSRATVLKQDGIVVNVKGEIKDKLT